MKTVIKIIIIKPLNNNYMKNWKEMLNEIAAFVLAISIMLIGIGLIVYYLKTGFTPVSILMGLSGFFILYPALKSWQERIKELF